jgi:tetratricopeptide (TPR) repeat protein
MMTVLGLIACITTALHAQPGIASLADSAAREIEAANARADTLRLRDAAALLDRALTVAPGDTLLLYYKALALYRQSGILTGLERNREAKRILEQADDLLGQVTDNRPNADALALHSAIIGQIIGSSGNPLTGMRLGPRSGRMMDRAVELAPNNPRVWLLKGISSMFTPALFGGGLDDAERHLRRATDLFAVERTALPAPSWGHADAWIWLGQTYERKKKPADARMAYERALLIAPDHGWVRQVLLPNLTKEKRP